MAERFDLDAIEVAALAADQGEYKAEDRTGIVADVLWDDEADQPVRLWWVDRPGWVEHADAEVLFYAEGDARYAETMHPKVALALLAELRAAREVVEALEWFAGIDWALANSRSTDSARAAWISIVNKLAAYDQATGQATQ